MIAPLFLCYNGRSFSDINFEMQVPLIGFHGIRTYKVTQSVTSASWVSVAARA